MMPANFGLARVKRLLAAAVAVFCAAGLPAPAASSGAWEMNSYRDFLSGRFSGVSLTRDGRLTLAPAMQTAFSSGQPVVWTVATAPDGAIYAGTGHRGRVYRIDKSGKSALLWTADQPEVFALALDRSGVLYAASSPNGKVYRIENGKPAEYFAPGAKYIWSLAFGPDGSLYVGTGDEGKIFRVTGPGKGELYYDSGQAHVTALAVDAQGRLLAGTEPNGIIYRVSAKDKAFVLYDANLPEIRTIVPAPDGAIYAAAMGGALAKQTQGAAAAAAASGATIGVTTTASSVSVSDAGATQAGPDLKPKPDAAKPQTAVAAQPATAAPAAQPVVDYSGLDKSAVYKIEPDNTVETLWTSKEENVYDLLYSSGQLVFSTDVQGRIYGLNKDRRLTLLAQTNEGETTRLALSPLGVLAATGEMGNIYRFGANPGPKGVYESPVHDVGTIAKWGKLSWRGDSLEPGAVAFRVRTGNSARPDKTWSDWSQPLTDPEGSSIPSPNARFIQWKAEFASAKAGPPAVDSVSVAYLPQNTAPALKAITVIAQLAPAGAKQTPASTAATYSITVTDTGTDTSGSAGTPTQTISRTTSEQLQVTWQAEDAEADRMVYALYFRGEGEHQWKLLKANLFENTYAIDADVLADGKYFFRVTASDSPSNPPSTARETELVSAPVLIDHTPPLVTAGTPRRSPNGVEIEFDAKDAASALRRCEYSIDAGNWVPMEPVDGVIDSPHETFLLRLNQLPAGEHVIVVRAFDTANNAGLAKVVIR